MAADDFMEAEVGIAVAATALVLSPKVRGWLRKGAVYGVAGVMMASDALTAGARGITRGATDMVAATDDQPAANVSEATEPAEGKAE